MPRNVPHLRVALASPGDVTAERKAFADLLAQINRDTGRAAGIELELVMWETEAKPGFHPMGPQGLIDKVLRIEDCDLFVGILWNRIGTPTPDGKTGTEHEFGKAYASWQKKKRPEIMFYFNERASNLTSKEALDQRAKVVEFRDAFPGAGLYWTYKGKAEFVKHASDQVRKYLQGQISMRARKRAGRRRPGQEAKNGQRVFALVIGKHGSVRFPAYVLQELGVTEGDSLRFVMSDHSISSVSHAATLFDRKAVKLLAKEQGAATKIFDAKFRQTPTKTRKP